MPAVATGPDALRMEVASAGTQHLHWMGTLDGVAITHVGGRNGPGTGHIQSDGTGSKLSWKAPGSSTYGTGVDCSAGGNFILCDGDDPDKFVRIAVTASRLPTSNDEAIVLLADVYNNDVASDDVSASEASAGDVETYTITLANDSTDKLLYVKVWIDSGVSNIEISDDGASWVTPTTEGTALSFGTIVVSGTDTLHVRRTIGAAAGSDPNVLTHLHASFESLGG